MTFASRRTSSNPTDTMAIGANYQRTSKKTHQFPQISTTCINNRGSSNINKSSNWCDTTTTNSSRNHSGNRSGGNMPFKLHIITDPTKKRVYRRKTHKQKRKGIVPQSERGFCPKSNAYSTECSNSMAQDLEESSSSCSPTSPIQLPVPHSLPSLFQSSNTMHFSSSSSATCRQLAHLNKRNRRSSRSTIKCLGPYSLHYILNNEHIKDPRYLDDETCQKLQKTFARSLSP